MSQGFAEFLWLEGWDIIYFNGGIYRSIWSTKTFLYNIRELRYKPNNLEYQIIRLKNNVLS